MPKGITIPGDVCDVLAGKSNKLAGKFLRAAIRWSLEGRVPVTFAEEYPELWELMRTRIRKGRETDGDE